MTKVSGDDVRGSVCAWLEKIVVGLQLCPFAGGELGKDAVRFSVTEAMTEAMLLDTLRVELDLLGSDTSIETTLLIHPSALSDFYEYNQFLDVTDRLLVEMGLVGVYQIASFHPDYRFVGTSQDDVENYTNRSPYPILHILREDSLERAIASHPDIADVPRHNIATMKSLGIASLKRLLAECHKGNETAAV